MTQTRYPISNNLVFTKVMSDNKDLCIEVVERMIGLEVEDIEYVNVEHMLPPCTTGRFSLTSSSKQQEKW